MFTNMIRNTVMYWNEGGQKLSVYIHDQMTPTYPCKKKDMDNQDHLRPKSWYNQGFLRGIIVSCQQNCETVPKLCWFIVIVIWFPFGSLLQNRASWSSMVAEWLVDLGWECENQHRLCKRQCHRYACEFENSLVSNRSSQFVPSIA